MYIIFILGTAGSGKSLLTSSLADWLRLEGEDVATVNLDPGAEVLPYTPDVDVRDRIRVEDVMREYMLGPNGAMILACDMVAERIDEIGEEVEDLRSEVVLVDTPGQVELFAFRRSGPYIASELPADVKSVLYLFDSVFSRDPRNYVMNLFLAAAIYNRFLLPQVHVLTKVDLISRRDLEMEVGWSEDVELLEEEIGRSLMGLGGTLSKGMMKAIKSLGLEFSLIPVSAKTGEGLINLYATLQRIFTGGERLTPR